MVWADAACLQGPRRGIGIASSCPMKWNWTVCPLLCSCLLAPAAHAGSYEDPARVRQAIRTHIQAGYADATVAISTPTLQQGLRMPPCAQSLEAFDPPGSRPGSRRTVGVRCPNGWTLYVPTQVTREVNMVVLARPISRGQVLSAQDIRVEQRPAASMPLGFVSTPDLVIGREAKQALPAGLALRDSHLGGGRDVQRGQQVRLLVQRGGLQIESQGIAESDAAVGHWVAVRNPRSGRVVEGRVQEPGLVRVP